MLKSKFFNRDGLIIIYCLVGSLLVLLAASYLAQRNALTQAKARMQGTLAFQTETLKTSLEKYTVLAALISRRPDIQLALRAKNPLDVLPSANELTLNFIGISGANDIWIADRKGWVLRKDQPAEKTTNIAQQSYFITAMQGSLGRGNVVSQTGQRLYIIASPVFYNNEILGVVVVRLNLEYLEQVLLLLPDPILIIDASQRVLLSSIRQWRLRYFDDEIKDNSFADKAARPLKTRESNGDSYYKSNLIEKVSSSSDSKLTFKEALRKEEGRVFLQVSQYVALLDWNIYIFVNYHAIRAQRNNAVLITFLVLLLIAMSFFTWRAHLRRLLKEQRSQLAFSLRLERQVRDRTHELSASNQQLNVEIDERRNAEKHLRDAQNELIQAAKLAGIGQMSTALAHEYNQPLAAIRSYADNATTFIDKDNSLSALQNLQRIKLLVDKMAGLTTTLRRFAHKSTHEYEFFSVGAVMDELIILLSPQAKKQNVSLQLCASKEAIYLTGEQGKLLQIVSNLVTNAMDAVTSCSLQQVKIEWLLEEGPSISSHHRYAIILIKDTGVGISEAVKANMFNAFYTTKKSGNGLGLGLFIVSTLLNDFKGTIALKEGTADSQKYGSIFELRLPLADVTNNR
ncbi:MAG: two-component system C4-dicarboxylate transport sensor histidine kinase DctB [Pseudohongiellaceae bacterium]|jgi:two-component system C4-dicarboxylate transport sensor histidine kinase DctB